MKPEPSPQAQAHGSRPPFSLDRPVGFRPTDSSCFCVWLPSSHRCGGRGVCRAPGRASSRMTPGTGTALPRASQPDSGRLTQAEGDGTPEVFKGEICSSAVGQPAEMRAATAAGEADPTWSALKTATRTHANKPPARFHTAGPWLAHLLWRLSAVCSASRGMFRAQKDVTVSATAAWCRRCRAQCGRAQARGHAPPWMEHACSGRPRSTHASPLTGLFRRWGADMHELCL